MHIRMIFEVLFLREDLIASITDKPWLLLMLGLMPGPAKVRCVLFTAPWEGAFVFFIVLMALLCIVHRSLMSCQK